MGHNEIHGQQATTVGNATRAEPSPYDGSLRKSEWLRNSKPSRLSFNARVRLWEVCELDEASDCGSMQRIVNSGSEGSVSS